jgi:hypothetical protein
MRAGELLNPLVVPATAGTQADAWDRLEVRARWRRRLDPRFRAGDKNEGRSGYARQPGYFRSSIRSSAGHSRGLVLADADAGRA